MIDDTPATKEDFDGLATEIRAFTRTVAAAVAQRANETQGGSATITVNAGGWGVAIATCAALFCLLLVIDMRNDQRDTRRQVERTQDYTNMLWQRYPELRPDKLQSEKKP